LDRAVVWFSGFDEGVRAVSFRFIHCADELEWLKARHAYVCGSEAAAVVGLSNWSSPMGLAYRKQSPVEPNAPTLEQRVGHALEPLIAACFSEATGKALMDPGDYTLAVNDDFAWLATTLDRLTEDGETVELKTAKFAAAKEWAKRVPIAYQVQCHVHMIVTGTKMSYAAVLLNCSEFKWFRVPYHERFAERLIERTRRFHERCIVGGERPDPDDSADAAAILAKLYPKSDGDGKELPSDFDSLGDEYDKLTAEASRIEKARRAIQNRVKDALGPAPLGRLSDGSGFRWSGDKARRFTRVKGTNDE
jgi:putative phage-type endonuclease